MGFTLDTSVKANKIFIKEIIAPSAEKIFNFILKSFLLVIYIFFDFLIRIICYQCFCFHLLSQK